MILLIMSFLFISFNALSCYISQPIASFGTSPQAVAFSPKGNCLAVANTLNNTVTLYNSTTCAGYTASSLFATISSGISGPLGISFSPDGTCLAVANSGNSTVTIYNSSTPCGFTNSSLPVATIDGSSGISSPRGVSFSPDGTCLAVANIGSGTVTIYTSPSCDRYGMATLIATITNSIVSPTDVAFSPVGNCLAVSDSINGTVAIYSSQNCAGYAMVNPEIISGINSASGVSFSPDGTCLAVANQSNVLIYNSMTACGLTSGSMPVAVISTSDINTAFGVSFSPDGTCLAVANGVNVLIYNSITACGSSYNPMLATTIDNGLVNIEGVSLSGDGTCLAVGNFGGNNVQIYNSTTPCGFTNSLTPVATIDSSGSAPADASLSADATCIAVANSGNNTVTIYNSTKPCGFTNSSMPIATLGSSSGINNPVGVSFSADATCLAVANSGNNTVTIYNSATPCGFTNSSMPIATFGSSSGINNPEGVSLSANATCLAVANSGNNTVTIYNSTTSCGFTNSSMPIATIDSSSGIKVPYGVSLSANATCLAVANSGNNTVTIYNSTTPCGSNYSLVETIGISSSFTPYGVSFSSDATCLAVGNFNNTVSFYAKLNPKITGPQILCPGTSGMLTADVSPFQDTSAPTYLSYQWQLGGNDISGATGNTYTTDSTLPAGTYVYRVLVTDPSGCGPVASPSFNLVVDDVIGTPASFTACSGVALNGKVNAISTSGSSIVQYDFTQPPHGQLGSVSNDDGLFVYTSTKGYAGSDIFTFTATDGYGCVSEPATVRITVDKARVVLSSSDVLPNVGVPVVLVATPTNGIAPFSFKWSDGLELTGSSAVTRVVEPLVNTTYSVTIIDSNGCQSDPSNSLTVTAVARSNLSRAVGAKYCFSK